MFGLWPFLLGWKGLHRNNYLPGGSGEKRPVLSIFGVIISGHKVGRAGGCCQRRETTQHGTGRWASVGQAGMQLPPTWGRKESWVAFEIRLVQKLA